MYNVVLVSTCYNLNLLLQALQQSINQPQMCMIIAIIADKWIRVLKRLHNMNKRNHIFT